MGRISVAAVVEWLAARGIAAFVLKRRLAREEGSTYRIEVESFADAQRAMRLVRSRAREWNVDPGRLGALGFSAGGELVAQISARFDAGQAESPDPIERQASRPAFQALIYPGRSGDIQPTKDSPPAFLAAAYNDRQDIAEGLAEPTCVSSAWARRRSSICTAPAVMGSGCARATGGRSEAGSCGSKNGSRRVGS